MARPRPKPTFEGQLPPPERNPLALSVSALLHVVVILVVMLLSKKLAEQQAETPKVDSAPTREVAMLYVPPPKPQPTVSVADAKPVVENGDGPLFATFVVRLAQASKHAVTVDYSTHDGTALAGVDYQARSGTL